MGFEVSKAIPWLSAAITGGAPGLAGLAVSAISQAIGIDLTGSNKTQVTKAIQDATPEQLAALDAAEKKFQVDMKQMGYSHEEELLRLELETTKTFVDDTKDAREKFASSEGVFYLGLAILVTFAVLMAVALGGSYYLLTSANVVTNPGLVAAVFGLVGTIIGYVAANAQQVVGYFFGSSSGSKEKSAALTDAISKIGAAV